MRPSNSPGLRLSLIRLQRRVFDLTRWRDALTRNLGWKALSLVLACGLWVFVNLGERDSDAAFSVRLELNDIPSGLVVTGARVDTVDLRLVGPRTLLAQVERQDLEIGLSLEGVRPGPAVFTVGAEGLNLPRGIRVVRINPAQISINLERVTHKSVPVQLRLEKQPPADFTIAATALSPDRVTITGPESVVRDIEMARTAPIDLSSASPGEIEQDLALTASAEDTSFDVDKVTAAIRIDDVIGGRTLDAVPIALRDAPGAVAVIRPQTVSVTVEGPQRLVRAMALESVVAWLTLAQAGPGTYAMEPEVKVPAGVRVISVQPRIVEVALAIEPSIVEPTENPAE